jgi:hypothetical protein
MKKARPKISWREESVAGTVGSKTKLTADRKRTGRQLLLVGRPQQNRDREGYTPQQERTEFGRLGAAGQKNNHREKYISSTAAVGNQSQARSAA